VIVDAIIPARDEEGALGGVLGELRGRVRRAIVVDNGSRDATAAVARAGGATVVAEPRRGYGAACLAGIAFLRALPDGERPGAVLFLDGDGADDARQAGALIDPIARGAADLVIGSRTLGRRERGALTPQQRAGNAVATALIGALYRHRFTDLGPFRAIRFPSLIGLAMDDRDYGWTVEMQVKALKQGLRVAEVPVDYRRRRAGESKVSSTVAGTIGAGGKILYTILRHAFAP
jgi:glycosyltransferase involved in cell wall biosynthesis